MARHSASGRPGPSQRPTDRSIVYVYRAREREEADDRRREALEREKRFAAALRLAIGPADGPANLCAAAEYLEARGLEHDAEVADGLRRRAEAIVEARAIVEAASWCPPE